jgi:hypothetical protein
LHLLATSSETIALEGESSPRIPINSFLEEWYTAFLEIYVLRRKTQAIERGLGQQQWRMIKPYSTKHGFLWHAVCSQWFPGGCPGIYGGTVDTGLTAAELFKRWLYTVREKFEAKRKLSSGRRKAA